MENREEIIIEEEPTLRLDNPDDASANNLATELKRRFLGGERWEDLNAALLGSAIAEDRTEQDDSDETVSPEAARGLGNTALVACLLSHTDKGRGINFDKPTSDEIERYIKENNYQHDLEIAPEGPEKERARRNAIYANLRVYGKRLIQYHAQQPAVHTR